MPASPPQEATRASLLASTLAAEQDRRPASIPPWVHANDGTEKAPPPPPPPPSASPLLPPADDVRPNTRHYKPPSLHYKLGRKWDHLRTAEPALLSAPIAERQAQWLPFMSSGPQALATEAGARVVDQAWMEENMPFLARGYEARDEGGAGGAEAKGGLVQRTSWLISPERQERTRLLLKNPFVPLFFRVTVLGFSAAALGIAVTIYRATHHVNAESRGTSQCPTLASTYIAMTFDSVAVPYLLYVTWDEYFSKPLGLRSAWAKTLLLLCDLFFIVFCASNLSLAFEALFDRRWACYEEVVVESDTHPATGASATTCPNNVGICYQQRALSSVLFVSLTAWMTTFSISVLRVVEKLRPD